MRKYYPGITLFKLIGSILIVLSHSYFFLFFTKQKFNAAELQSFTDVIVPCFYMIAGFLAYQGWSNAENSDKYIARYLRWILSIYGIICLIYLFTDVSPVFFSHRITVHFVFEQLKFVFAKIFIFGPFSSLWFIPSLIFSVIISYYFERRKKLLIAIIITAIGFIASMFISGTLKIVMESLIGDKFYHPKYMTVYLFQMIITYYFGYGLPFVLAGVIIAKNEDQFMQIKLKQLILCAVIVTLAEYMLLDHLVKKDYPYLLVFSRVINSVLLFYGILHIKIEKIKTHHYAINLFTIVLYFSHTILISINTSVLNWNLKSITVFQSAFLVLLTLFEGLLLTVFIKLGIKNIKSRSKKQRILSEAA